MCGGNMCVDHCKLLRVYLNAFSSIHYHCYVSLFCCLFQWTSRQCATAINTAAAATATTRTTPTAIAIGVIATATITTTIAIVIAIAITIAKVHLDMNGLWYHAQLSNYPIVKSSAAVWSTEKW
jgi:hypothetical protein